MRVVLAAILAVVSSSLLACGSPRTSPTQEGGDSPEEGEPDAAAALPPDAAAECTTLRCRQVTCPGGGTTRLVGTIYTPAGNLALPRVHVYVPTAPLAPLATGASCSACDAELSGFPLVRAVSDASGGFALDDVPTGDDVPLVLQTGPWRRQVVVPHIEACVDNPLDAEFGRLPRDQSEGDLPRVALTTGGYDALECLLRKIGVADSEFTPESGPGRVNLFAGYRGAARYADEVNGGAPFTPAAPWWDELSHLLPYDMVIHSCDGQEAPTDRGPAAAQALHDYAGAGGRVFASHFHSWWYEHGPGLWPTVATWLHGPYPPTIVTGHIRDDDERGKLLADWLLAVGGSAVYGELKIFNARRTAAAVNEALARSWIELRKPDGALDSVQYLSFDTPLEAAPEDRCGRAVLSDIHVSGDATINPTPFPHGCNSTVIYGQEKALIYMLFDLTSCAPPEVE